MRYNEIFTSGNISMSLNEMELDVSEREPSAKLIEIWTLYLRKA
jgi:hypothetical protein